MVWMMTDRQEGRMVGRIVTSDCGVSAHRYAQLKQTESVLLDGVPAHANVRVRAGQKLSILLDAAHGQGSTPEWVVYEDADLLIANKPAPMSSMRSKARPGGTLEDLVTDYLGCYRPVNRLDKGTSGLMVVAKTAYAQARLQRLLHTQDFIREYIAVLDHRPQADEGLIDLPIGMAGETGVKRAVVPDGRPCGTRYRFEGLTAGGRAIVSLRLITGRTHQIRVHMAAIGCPVTGDYLYGAEHPLLEGRFALHSARVCLRHPVTGEIIERTAPTPAVFFTL